MGKRLDRLSKECADLSPLRPPALCFLLWSLHSTHRLPTTPAQVARTWMVSVWSLRSFGHPALYLIL